MTVSQKVDLHESLRRWVAEGLLDPGQAERIECLETGSEAPEPPPLAAHHERPTRVAYTIEALGYLGATLAVIAAFITVGELWPNMPVWVQVGLAAAGAVLLAVAGVAVPAAGNEAFARLRSVLRLLSTACVATLTSVVGAQVLHLPDEDTFLFAAAVTAAAACGWWFLGKVALQHIAMFVALALTVVAMVLVTVPEAHSWWVGVTIWACSAAWIWPVQRGLVPPRHCGLAVAVVGLVTASPIMARFGLGTLLALATVGALLAAGVVARQVWLLGAGALLTLLVVPQAAEQYLPESVAAPLAVFLVGVVLVGSALWLARRGRPADSERT